MSNDSYKTAFDQLSKCLELIREGKRKLEIFSRILQAFIADDEVIINPKSYTVKVDHKIDVDQMIKDGNYDFINPHINRRLFQAEPENRVELVHFKLVHFNRTIGVREALDEINIQGLKPVNLIESLSFAAKFPDIQRQYSIICLNSHWIGNQQVLGLCGNSTKRELILYKFQEKWAAHFRFLCIHK